MVVIVFRTRLREGVDEQELERVGARMYELAAGMAGFVSYKDYAAADGEFVSVVEFDSLETLAAWRDHPEHLKAQQEGRDRFYASYSISIAKVERSSEYDAATKQWTRRP